MENGAHVSPSTPLLPPFTPRLTSSTGSRLPFPLVPSPCAALPLPFAERTQARSDHAKAETVVFVSGAVLGVRARAPVEGLVLPSTYSFPAVWLHAAAQPVRGVAARDDAHFGA